jgi:hypothetical protein
MSWTLPVCLITAACHARVARLMEGDGHAANFAPTPES